MTRTALSAAAFFTRTAIVAGILLTLFGQSAQAQTSYSWAAATSGNWPDATQWIPTSGPGATFPVAGDFAAFNGANANAAETIFLNGNQAAASLTFSNTSTTAFSTGPAGGPLVNNQSLTVTGGISVNSGAGAVSIGSSTSGNNVLVVANGSQSFTNNSAALFLFGNGSSTSTVCLQAASGTPSTVTFAGAGNITVTGETKDGASGGTLTMIKNGAGTLELDANAAGTFFTGGLTVNAGLLSLKGSNALGTTANTLTINGGGVASNAAARTLPAAISIVIGGDFSLGTGTTGGFAITFSGPMNLGGATRNIVFNNSATFGGIISNGGITKVNSSIVGNTATTLTLSAANTYAGATTINAGTIAASNSGVFSSNSPVILPTGGILNLAGFSQTIASLSDGGGAGGSVTIGNAIAGILTLGGDNSSTTFSGVISGTGTTSGGGITKNGTGIFTLSSLTGNTYGTAGNAVNTVNNGTLSVTNTSGSATGPGVVNVNGGAAPGAAFGNLAGTGHISGLVTVNAGAGGGPNGEISPGTAATLATGLGTLTLTGGLTLPGTYVAVFDPDNNNSTDLAVTGNLNLSGLNSTLVLSQSDLDAPVGTFYTLATFTGTLTGTFANVIGEPPGYQLNYNTNSITLTPSAVPEPGSMALMACAGLTGGLGLRVARRRRQRA